MVKKETKSTLNSIIVDVLVNSIVALAFINALFLLILLPFVMLGIARFILGLGACA